VHFLQIWIRPEAFGIRPGYEQKSFEPSGESRFTLIASRDGRDGSVTIHQDAALSLGRVRMGEEISRALGAGRRAWLQVTRGAVALGGELLEAGDGAALKDEAQIAIKAAEDAEVLLFDICLIPAEAVRLRRFRWRFNPLPVCRRSAGACKACAVVNN
jgi:redox-sensitive bicupin YhaK (pirin superfamily)